MKCKECGSTMQLMDGRRGNFYACRCGWKINQDKVVKIIEQYFGGDTAEAETKGDKTLQDWLTPIFKRAERKHNLPIDWPQGDYTKLTNLWVSFQEPCGRHEHEEPGQGWPYANRLACALRPFLKFTHEQQVYVLTRIKQGIPYRGDTFEFYKMVCNEYAKMGAAIPGAGKRYDDLTDQEREERLQYTSPVMQAALMLAKKWSDLPYDKTEREPGITRTSRENPDPENR